jgi:hypothetical protein
MITARIIVATVIMTAVAWGIWKGLDSLLGTSLVAQIISLGVALSVACVLYAKVTLAMRIPEARQIEQLVRQRLGRASTA